MKKRYIIGGVIIVMGIIGNLVSCGQKSLPNGIDQATANNLIQAEKELTQHFNDQTYIDSHTDSGIAWMYNEWTYNRDKDSQEENKLLNAEQAQMTYLLTTQYGAPTDSDTQTFKDNQSMINKELNIGN